MSDIRRGSGPRYYVPAVLAFVLVTFAVQATSHFAINAEHYAAIGFLRKNPVMELGFLTMILQGTVLAYFYPFFYRSGSPVVQGLKFGLLMGLFLGSYIAFAEPAKYAAPSIGEWIAVEGPASLIQFSLYGILVGLIHGRADRRSS
jgi:hypothetical protein